MNRSAVTPLLLLAACTACSQSSSGESQKKPTDEQERKLAGVYPENFKCDSIATPDALAQVLGASARQVDSPSSIPRGVPHPCTYEVATQLPEYWTFDFDCRDGMKQRADALFAQYTRTSADLMESYNAASDAGPKPGIKPDAAVKDPDAGPEPIRRAPEAAAEVAVGAKALDHHGQGLLFIDDDAPCYVRVVGPDSARRLALAQLIAKNLTFANAPMTPRAFK
jgi:hypothetical protein